MATLKKTSGKPLTDEEIEIQESENLINNLTFSDSDSEGEVYELLAGYVDENGVTHKTFTLREMTGRDEEAINRADIKSNGGKVITTLLTKCVTSIGTLTPKSVGKENWSKIIQSLYVGDRDYMIIKLRKLSIGDEVELQHTCPKCNSKISTIVDLDEIEVIPFQGTRVIHFELPKGYKDKRGNVHRTGTFRLTNGLDQEILIPVAIKNTAKANTLLLTRLCRFDDGYPIDEDLIGDLTIKDRDYLNKLLIDNRFGVDLSTEVTCESCGNVFEGSFNPINFI